MKERLTELRRRATRFLARLESISDKNLLSADVPLSQSIAHAKWPEYLYQLGNKAGLRILEIGSREVTAASEARKRFAAADYVGFDYYEGSNVDVVGDVHRLSSYFKPGEQFDLIFTSACFEHFAMPWIAAVEISKMLKVGGTLFVETHFSYSAHERPWNFFQFSDMGLRVLFSNALGFECIEAGMSNPIIGRFSKLADEDLRYRRITGLYCHSEYLGRKVREVPDFNWQQVDLAEVVSGSTYPSPKGILPPPP